MFRKIGPIGASAPTADTTYDNIQGQEIMTDPRVIADVRRDFEDRGIYIEDDDALMRKWYDDQTYTNLNATIGPFNAYQRAEAATPESRARQARLRDAYQKLPMFYQGGGVGTGTAIPSMAKAIVLDPLNLVGGFIGLGGKAVAKSAILATKAGKSPALAAAKAAASRTAMYEGALGGAFGGVYSVGQQSVDIKLGLQDQFSVGRLAGDVALEGAFSGALGAGIGGAAGAVFQGGAARRAAMAELEAEGLIPTVYSGDAKQHIAETRARADEAELAGDEDAADALNAEADADEAALRNAEKAEAEAKAAETPAEDAPAAEATEAVEPEAAPAPVTREGTLTDAGQKLAEKEGVDTSVDPETGVFADERLETYVQARAAEKDAPVNNRLTVQDMRQALNVGTSAEAKVARKLARDKKAVEDSGRPVTEEETNANIEKIAEEQELDQEVLAKEAALAEQEIVRNTIEARAEVFKNFTDTQRKRYNDRVPALQKQLMEADPELDEATALGRARGEAIDEIARGKTVSGRTGKRQTTSGKATDAMRTAENAGRTLVDDVDTVTGVQRRVPGGLQKIFKGIVLPTRGSIEKAKAIAVAEKTADLVAFTAKARQNAITKSGRVEKVSRGAAVVYDPESKKFFGGATEDEAMTAVRKFYENDELGRAAKAAEDEAAVAEFIDKNGATQLDIGQTSKALQDDNAQVTQSVAGVRDGGVLTIKWKGDKADAPRPPIRQLRANQLADGSMHKLISGHTNRSKPHHKNPENWEIYYAPMLPEGAPRSLDALEALIADRKPVPLSSAAAPAQVDGDPSRFGAPAFDDIADNALPEPETAAEEAMFEVFRQNGRAMDTYRNLLTRENEILDASILGMEGDAGRHLQTVEIFLSYMDRVLPNYVKFPTGTRVAARAAFDSMAGRYPKSTIQFAQRIMDSSRAEGAPVIRFVDGVDPQEGGTFYNPLDPVGDGSAFNPAGVVTRTTDTGEVVTEAAGVVEINTNSQLHPAHILLHEMAHWSMSYVMTPRMKLQFVQELATYITPDGKIDMKRLGLADAPNNYNAGANIKEIMANLFTKWASDTRFRAAFQQQKKSFFTKITGVFKKAFNFFMGGGVPEEFDPIFANLMADGDARMFRIDDFENLPDDPTAQEVMRRYKQTSDTRRITRDANSRDNYSSAVEATFTLLHGLSNSEAQNEIIGRATGQGAFGNNTGVFGPSAKFVARMRDALRDLHRIADDQPDLSDADLEDFGNLPDGFGVTGGYNFDEAKTRELAALYDETINPLLEEISREFEVQFDMFSLKQHPRQRRSNRVAAEALKNGPQPQNKKARKKKQAEAAAQRSFGKTAPKTDEEVANEMAAVDLPPRASMEELVESMDVFAMNTSPNRAAAQRIKRQMDAGSGDKVVEDQRTAELLETEAKYNDMSLDGVSLEARPQISRIQSEMNARTELAAANMRQMFFRFTNMLGLAEPDGTIKDADLAPLLGLPPQNGFFLLPQEEALSSSTPVFRRLRSELRKIGQGLENGTDVIPDVVVMTIRASGDMNADTIDGQPADQFMAMVVNELLTGRATPDDIFPNSPDRGALIDAANGYVDRVGYIVNGLISNESLRKKYPGLEEYGHMMTLDHTKRPVTLASGMGNPVAPQVAADAFDEALNYGTQRLRTNIVRFTRGAFNLMPNNMPSALYVPVRRGQKVDARGRAQTNGMFGMATYVSPDPMGALRTKKPDVLPQDGDAPFGDTKTAEALMELIADVDAQIQENRYAQVSLEGAEASAAVREMTELLRDREKLLERLDQTGRSFDDVAPVITNAKAVANLSATAEYQRVSPIMEVMTEAAFDQDKSRAAGWVGSFPDEFDGEDLYVATKGAIMAQGLTDKQANTKIKNALRKAGYDGVMGTMDDNGVNRPIIALFDGDSVRSLQSPDMKIDVPDDSVPARIGTEFFELLASEKTLPPSAAAALEDHLIFGLGVPKPMAASVAGMATGNRKNVLQRGWDAAMRGASGRFQQAGMRFLDERFDLFSTEHTRKMGQKLMGTIDKLNGLPGMPSGLLAKVANYMTTAAQGNPNYGIFKEPKPMQAIRAAMIDPSKAANLTPEQQTLYAQIRSLFQKQLREMQDAGIQVGNLGPDYFPQVWNPQIVRKDPDGFKSLMAAYYQQENATASSAEATAFADKIFKNITENESGVLDLDADNAAAMVDSTTFGRLLNFHTVAPQLLDSAEAYMEQSLMATMVRYFDQTERAIQQAKQLGVNGHMVGDYAKAVMDGEQGMIELLSTPKQFSITQRTVMPGGGVEKTNKVFTHDMLTPAQAKSVVKSALKDFNKGDIAAAKTKMLGAFRGPRPAKTTYERRVDAIIGALQDFRGQPATLSEGDLNAVNGYSRLIMRKRADGSTRSAQNFTRGLRMFQNITLLPYAAITSFSDLALPIIRSGDFKAAWTGWSRYLTNKQYRDTIRQIGVNMDGITHERMAQLVGDADNVVQSTFFKMTGLTPWTNVNRAGSAAIGMEAMRHHMAAMQKMGPAAVGSSAYNLHDRFLKAHGLTYDPSKPVPDFGSDEAYQRAVIRFVDNTIFSPKPQDMPLYANTPWGGLAYQLKSFSIMYGRFAKEMLVDDTTEAFRAVAKGNFNTARKYMTRPTLLMTLGPAVAAGSLATKDVVMSRGGEDSQSIGLSQERAISDMPFIKTDWLDEEVDAIAGWYLTAFMQAGGLGLFGDLLHDAVQQSDNGAFGQQRMAEAVLGPTYGMIFGDVFNVGAAAMNAVTEAATGEGSAGVQRQGVREVVSRVPVLGGNRAFREGAVDLVRQPSTKSSGVGGGPFKRTTYGTTNF